MRAGRTTTAAVLTGLTMIVLCLLWAVMQG
jgi:hypothetical protein